MTLYPKLILDALATVRYPGNGKNIVEAEMVADNIRIDGMKVSFSLIFEKPTDPFMKSVVKSAETAIHTYISKDVEVTIATESRQAARPEPGKMLPQVKNVIAVSSGKGGVGKSTVAANLAVALSKLGYKVGLLDADIFGPSVPKMFQVEDARPYAEMVDGRDLIVPIEKYGIELLSIGFFVDPDQATLWRGGMASNALKQLVGDAKWGDLDYFILDTPPGTSDIHLTLLQTLAITGAVIVSTPQQVALADARKGINMYMNDKVNVPILGLVENMSWFTPAELPENKYYIFGKEGTKKLAEELNVPLLGQIPIVQSICENGDKGTPVALLLIVDDHPIVAEGIVSIASQQSNILCKSITRMENLLPTISAESFDLCIIDLELPEINGFQLIHLLQEQMPDCKILIYTMHEEPWVIAKLAEEEISGAVSKNASTSELKQAITQIRLGHKYFSEVFSILHKKQINIDLHKIPELSKREKEVLTYLSEGLSTSEISDLLCLSTNTIQTYRKRLMEKLEAKNVAELVYKGKEIF